MREITDFDRYCFDLNGYIVVRGALAGDELDRVVKAVDACTDEPTQERPDTSRFQLWNEDQTFRDLLDHPSVFPYLLEWVDRSVRVDDLCHTLVSIASERSHGGGLHMGGTPYSPLGYYHCRNGKIHCGLTVVLWVLTDQPGDGSGGFACIPGSHKADFPLPSMLRAMDQNPEGMIRTVDARAGDAIIFTEALTHSRFPWQNPWTRKALFYRYTPGHMVFESPNPLDPDAWAALTVRQRQLFEPPYTRLVTYDGGRNERRRAPIRQVVEAPPGHTRAIDCMCGASFTAPDDDGLAAALCAHADDAHPERGRFVEPERLRRYIQHGAYDVG